MKQPDWERLTRINQQHLFTGNVTEWLCTCGKLLAGKLVQFDTQTIKDNLAEARQAHDEHLRTLIEGVNDDGNIRPD